MKIHHGLTSTLAIVMLGIMMLFHPLLHGLFGGADDAIMMYLASMYHSDWR